MIGAPEPKKLTLIEKNLQQAAAQGKYETFFHYLQTLKKLNGGKLSAKQFQDIFCDPQYNVLKGLMRKSSNRPPDLYPLNSNSPSVTIALTLLNEMQQLGIPLIEVKYGTPVYYDPATRQSMTGVTVEDISPIRVYEWAADHELTNILSQPLVQRELVNDEIQSNYLTGNAHHARDLFREQQVEHHLVENEVFNTGLLISIIHSGGATPGALPLSHKVKDNLFTDLLDHHNISLPELIGNIPPMTYEDFANFNIHDVLANFDKVKDTLAYKAYDAMRTMEMEAAPPNTPKAIKLLERYLNGISNPESKKNICQQLFFHFANLPGWTPMPGIADPHLADKRNILVTILKEMRKAGAKNAIPLSPPMALPGMYGYLPLDQLITLDDNSGEILSCPEIFASLASIPPMESQIKINQLMNQMQPNAIPPVMTPNLVALKSICRHAKPCFQVGELTTILKAHPTDPADPNFAALKQYAEDYDRAVALLIANHLIVDLENLKPGSHGLPATFPAVNLQPADLYQYIQDNPILKHAYEKQKRDETLLEEYSLIKAVLSEDPRTEDELRRIDSSVSPIQQGEHQHTLGAIRDFIRDNDRTIVPGGADIATEIFKHLNQANVSEARRERAINRMSRIADRASRSSDGDKPADVKGKKHRP